MSVLETYLNTLATLRYATVPETSYYAALQTLLNDVGAGLCPRVQAVIYPKNTGAGIPDLGLFDENQPTDQKPARGIIEAKPVSDDLMKIAQGEQMARYVAHYGQALVTNYYQFVLVTRDAQTGLSVMEERYDLSASANAFWEAVKQPHGLVQQHETALREYLIRVMRRNAPLSTPQDVAWILASYAREARARIAVSGTDLTALDTIREQLEAALGVRFEDETAEEFFRSTLMQALFYGLFSAWVLWHEKHPGAVQYFYEPFLEAFDPELRRQLGVWYTPPEVVEYMVARVDLALKSELGIPNGLADSSVYVLDPYCGTGAYLVAVLRHIYASLQARDGDALAAQAMRERVFGFEILPAPFLVRQSGDCSL
jgi:N-6 DNA Methylase